MRIGWVAGVLLVARVASGDPIRNDPAFLGIGMQDIPGLVGCQITSVIDGAAAATGGLSRDDVVVALDGVPVTTCDQLSTQITRHASGDTVTVELLGTPKRTHVVQLTSRTEVMRRGLLGRTLEAEVDVVERNTFVPADLKSRRGQITILGWFTPDCVGCDQVFARVSRWTTAHRGATALGVTYDPHALAPLHAGTTVRVDDHLMRYHFDVPVALTDAPGNASIDLQPPVLFDPHRITFTIVDAHGEVTYVAPLALDGEDTSAGLDELFVAASQAISPHGLHAISRR